MAGTTIEKAEHIGDGFVPHQRTSTAAERWEWVVPHRDQLLSIARRRTVSEADAEDCVHEAMVRAVERDDLDPDRVGAFLCATVLRIVVDGHRTRERGHRAGVRDWRRQVAPVGHEEAVCQREQARWLVRQLTDVRGRESEVLQARADGMSVSDFAAAKGISLKAAENAWTRARQKAQRVLAATAALLAPFSLLRRGGLAAPAVVATALGVLLWDVSAVPSAKSPAPVEPAGVQRQTSAPLPPEHAEAPLRGEAVRGPSHQRPAELLQRGDAAEEAVPASSELAPPLPTVDVAPVDAGLVRIGGMRTEERNTDESLEESVANCLENLDPAQPLKDPCDY